MSLLMIECKVCKAKKEYIEFPKTYSKKATTLNGSYRKVCKPCMVQKKREYMKKYYIDKLKKPTKPKKNKYEIKDNNKNMIDNIIITIKS